MQWLTKTAVVSCFAALAGLTLASAQIHAQTPDAELDLASRAFRQGNYRLAAERLTTMSKSVDQFLPQQQLTYWDLRANVAQASGLPSEAQQATIKHLALLKQASAMEVYERRDLERHSLVRLAQIKRELSNAEKADGGRPSTGRALQQACELYRRALQIPRANDGSDALWEPETRFELAQALETLNEREEAKAEYAAAARSAEAALARLKLADEAIDEFLRGAALVRQAFLSGQKVDERKQAAQAVRLLEARLRAAKTSPSSRVKLLSAVAACYRQSENTEQERQILEQLIQIVEKKDPQRTGEVVPLARAESLVRFAELIDRGVIPQANSSRLQSDPLYREAAELYREQLAALRKANGQPKGNAKQSDEQRQSTARAVGMETECLMQLQLIYMRLEDWSAAIDNAQQLAKLRGSLLAEYDPNYYRTLSALGSLYAKRTRAAQMRSVGDDQELLSVREDVNQARKYLSVARAFWEKYEPRSPKDQVATLNHYAEVLRYDGDFRSADALLNEIAEIAKSHRVYGQNDLRLAEFYTNRAAVQAALGQFFLALGNYREAARIAGAPSADDREMRERRRLLAMVYLNVAQLHKSQRQLEKARRACEGALSAAEKAGLTPSELVPFQLAKASLLVAEAEHDAARPATRSSDGNPESVKDLQNGIREKLEHAVGITKDIVANGSAPLEMATARHLQALARYRHYELCGDDERQLQTAEQLWTQLIDKSGSDIPQIANLRTRATNYLVVIALRDLSVKRRRLYDLSLAENRDEDQIAALAGQCDERIRQANLWSQSGEQSAGEMVAYPAIHVQALLARAQVLRANAKIHQAKAKSLGESNPAQAAREAKSARAALDDAIAKLRQALKTIEMPRAMTVGAEQERAEYFAQFAPVFDLLVDLLYENGLYIEAIQVADTRRSRTFQDQLRASGVDLNETADPKLVKAAKIASDRYYATLARLNENWSNAEQREALSAKLEKLRGEFVRAEQEVKSTSSAARQLLLEADQPAASASPPSENEWINEWIGDDTVALVYYVGAANSYVFACGRKLGVVGQMLTFTHEQGRQRGLSLPALPDGQSNQLPLRADHVARLVRDVRAGAARLPESARREVRATRGPQTLQLTVSTKVGPEADYVVTDILLPRELRQKIVDARPRHVIVVPDGALHELPLELLPYERERKTYLLDTLPPISYAPSLHIYRRLRDDSRFGDWDVALVSLADPSYRPIAPTSAANAAEGLSSAGQEFLHHWRGGFARLEGFKKESDAVCAAFQQAAPNPGSIMPLVDKNANEENLKNALQAHRIGFLHVAAHGLVSQEYNNLFGALALTPPDRPTDKNDGFLSLHEVFKLPLKGCEMVVLSACETNCGAESPLEAGSTMARAFICAGAKRVVCSHWEVDDVATTELVTGLMQQVSNNLAADRTIDFAAALHAAKRELRHKTNSPYFWAPFVLVGPPSNDSGGKSPDTVAAQRN